MTLPYVLVCQTLAFVFYFLHSSFFEWAFHKYLFHSPKYIKATFRAHALVHHQRYKYAKQSYEWQEGQEKDHITMDWFAPLLFIGVHLPYFLAIQYITGIPSVWGGIAAVLAYYTVYEYFHYFMHVPSNRWFENLTYFKFVKEHHRIHHKFMLKNLNVFFPLADLCMGTYRSAASVTAASSAREAAAPNPAPTAERTVTVKPLHVGKQAEAFSEK